MRRHQRIRGQDILRTSTYGKVLQSDVLREQSRADSFTDLAAARLRHSSPPLQAQHIELEETRGGEAVELATTKTSAVGGAAESEGATAADIEGAKEPVVGVGEDRESVPDEDDFRNFNKINYQLCWDAVTPALELHNFKTNNNNGNKEQTEHLHPREIDGEQHNEGFSDVPL